MEANFNQPQKQSPIGVLVIFIDSLQKLGRAFLPLIFIFFIKADEFKMLYAWLGIAALVLITALIAYLRYQNFTFYIDDENDEFVISDGVINKTKTTIQLNKIQQVNIKQNLIQRIIGVYALDVDTAGSDKKEGDIKAVSHDLAVALKAKLLDNEHRVTSPTVNEVSQQVKEGSVLPFLKINLISLLKIGITSNYVKSVGLILTFFFTVMENLRNIGKDDLIDGDKIESFVASNSVLYSGLLFVLMMFTVIFIINIGRTLIKFFDYTVTKQKGSFMLSHGLINTQSTILKPEKVQIVKVSQNYFQKKLNVLEIRIKQALSNEKQEKKSLIEIPGCNNNEKNEILRLLFKQLPEKGVMMQPNFRKLGFSVFLIIILPLAGYFWFGHYVDKVVFDYSHFAVFYAIFCLVILYFGFKNYRLFINDRYIIKQSGAWDISDDIIQIEKIQAITTSQLFWHKTLNIGSLTMHTAGGNITFYLGKFDKINEYVNLWLYEIETSNSNWI